MVDTLVNKEVDERVALLIKALDTRETMKRDLKKIKPDQQAFAADGTMVETYSKAKWEESQKATQALARLEDAITQAISGDFKKLKEQVR